MIIGAILGFPIRLIMAYLCIMCMRQWFFYLQVISAEGEHNASRALKAAADVIDESGSALQLRYLQTLTAISAEKNSTILFPVPINLLGGFIENRK